MIRRASHRTVREIQKARLKGETFFRVWKYFVPDELPDELCDWPELEHLVLDGYTGPLAKLARLPGLRRLHLKGGQVPSDLAELAVPELIIEHDALVELPRLEHLTSLRQLRLECPALARLPDLSRLGRLEELRVSSRRLTSLPETVGELVELRRLWLRLDGLNALPASLYRLPMLEELVALAGQLTLAPEVSRLPRLRKLALTLPIATPEEFPVLMLPDSLGDCSALEELAIGRLLPAFPELVCELVNLRRLELTTMSNPSLPAGIGKLTGLEELKLWKGYIAQVPDSIGRCTALRSCDLQFNSLTRLPPALLELPALEQLNVDWNPLVELPELTRRCAVKKLQLQLPLERLPETIARYDGLEELIVSQTRLTGLPDGVAELPNLRKLTVSYNENMTEPPAILDVLATREGVELAIGGNAWQLEPEDEDQDEDFEEYEDGISHHPKANRWIHGMAMVDGALVLDVETVLDRHDYPASQRSRWRFDLGTGTLAHVEDTSEAAIKFDCGYHREHFTNTLAPALALDGWVLPGNDDCFASPLGPLVRQHTYGNVDVIDAIVAEDELYVTVKTSTRLDRSYHLVRGASGGRVWNAVATRDDEVLCSLVRFGGKLLAGSYGRRDDATGAIYLIDRHRQRLVPYVAELDAALMVADGERLLCGGGPRPVLYEIVAGPQGGCVTRRWRLDFASEQVAKELVSPALASGPAPQADPPSPELRARAELLFAVGVWSAAAPLYETLAAASSELDDRVRFAECLAQMGELERAAGIYTQLASAHPPSALALARLARSLHERDHVFALYRRACAANPTDARARVEMALHASSEAERTAALEQLVAETGDVEARWHLATTAMVAARWADALAHTRALTQQQPSSTIFRAAQVVCAERAGRAVEALVACEQLLVSRPMELRWHAARLRLLERTEPDANTIDAALRYQYDLEELQSTYRFATIWLERRDNLDAVGERLHQALALLPECLPLVAASAYLRILWGELDAAERLLDRCLENDQLRFYRGLLGDLRGDPTEALRWYEQLSSEYLEQVPLARYNLALARRARDGDDIAMLRAMSEVIARAPGFSPAYNNRAYGLYLRGEHVQGRRDVQRALELDETNAPAWLTRAALDLAAKDVDAALVATERALECGASLAAILGDPHLEPLHAELRRRHGES